MIRLVALPLVLLLLVAPLGIAPASEGEAALAIVGYEPDNAPAAQLAIQAAGGRVVRSSAELGFSVVQSSDRARFERLMSLNPAINYIEDDGATRLQGAQWNAGQWNGAQWNGAQWNGGQWNGGQWNAGQWNGGQWNQGGWSDAQRQAFAWSLRAYLDHGQGFEYDIATSDPGLLWQWGAWEIGSPVASMTWSGASRATLCVLDSGVAFDHPDLAPNMWSGPMGERGFNVIDPNSPPYDFAGHGTHVAGIAAARVGNAYGTAGVANVKIMSVKVLDDTGNGLEDHLAIGIAWCADHGASVAVMALGVTQPGPTLDRAIAYAAERDVLMLASAGNAGPCVSCVGYPASDPRVLAVAAAGARTIAPFSSSGPEVALAAPGVDILGPLPGPGFAFGSGTSQAVAMAAGVAALVRDAAPGLTAAQAASVLSQSATDFGTVGPDPSSGAGLVNAKAALALARPG